MSYKKQAEFGAIGVMAAAGAIGGGPLGAAIAVLGTYLVNGALQSCYDEMTREEHSVPTGISVKYNLPTGEAAAETIAPANAAE